VNKVIKRTLLCLLTITGFVVLAISGLIVYASSDHRDTFVLKGAEFADIAFLQKMTMRDDCARSDGVGGYQVFAHRLKRGNGTIFGFRLYSPGPFGTTDTNSYKKVTLWIANIPPTSQTTVSLGIDSDSFLAVTEGSSVWPRSACSWIATAGVVMLEPRNHRFRVAMHAQITPEGASVTERCQPETLDLTFAAKEIRFEQLTPWLGKEGHHSWDETHRPMF
jgi:hypothetical protein